MQFQANQQMALNGINIKDNNDSNKKSYMVLDNKNNLRMSSN